MFFDAGLDLGGDVPRLRGKGRLDGFVARVLVPNAGVGRVLVRIDRLGQVVHMPGEEIGGPFLGQPMPALLDESTPQRPTTAKGRIRVAMERELERRAVAGRLRATVITAGDFFGAGSGSWFDAVVVKSIATGRLGYPGDPSALPEQLRQRELAPRTRKPLAAFVFTGDWGRPAPQLPRPAAPPA